MGAFASIPWWTTWAWPTISIVGGTSIGEDSSFRHCAGSALPAVAAITRRSARTDATDGSSRTHSTDRRSATIPAIDPPLDAEAKSEKPVPVHMNVATGRLPHRDVTYDTL